MKEYSNCDKLMENGVKLFLLAEDVQDRGTDLKLEQLFRDDVRKYYLMQKQ